MKRSLGLCGAITISLLAPAASQAKPMPSIPLPSPLPRVQVVDDPGCGLSYAASYSGNVISLCPGYSSRALIEHERGHAFDEHQLDSGERARFMRLARLRGSWDEETFADAYSSCRRKLDPARGWDSDGYWRWEPTAHMQRLVCGFIARAAR